MPTEDAKAGARARADLERQFAETVRLKEEVSALETKAGEDPKLHAQLQAKKAELEQKREKLHAGLGQSIEKGHLDVSTPKDRAVFYDNGYQGWSQGKTQNGEYVPGSARTNRDRAADFCEKNKDKGYQTLESTPGGQWLNDQKTYEALGPKRADESWAHLSHQYASKSQGEVHAFVRSDSDPRRVFEGVEKDALRNNRDVNQIVYHKQQHGLDVTHYEHLPKTSEVSAGRRAKKDMLRDKAGHGVETPGKDAPSR